jgi:hypothetical protein
MSRYVGGNNQQASSCNTKRTRNLVKKCRYVPFTRKQWNALPGAVQWQNIDVGPGKSREEIELGVKKRMRNAGFSSSDDEVVTNL